VSGFALQSEIDNFYGLRFNIFGGKYVDDAIKFRIGGKISNETEVEEKVDIDFSKQFTEALYTGLNETKQWSNTTIYMTKFNDFRLVEDKKCQVDLTLETNLNITMTGECLPSPLIFQVHETTKQDAFPFKLQCWIFAILLAALSIISGYTFLAEFRKV
jgi:hypothetical protein